MATGLRSRETMEPEDRPRDADPSEMTDFEKNATLQELEQVVPESDPDRARQEKGNRGPDQEPGFGQGARHQVISHADLTRDLA